MEARLAQAEARLTRATSLALGVAPGPSLEQPKRTNKRKNREDDIEEEEEENVDGEEIEITGGNIDGEEVQPEVIEGPARRGSSDTEQDGSWRPPPQKGKGKARRGETPSTVGDLDGEEIESLG